MVLQEWNWRCTVSAMEFRIRHYNYHYHPLQSFQQIRRVELTSGNPLLQWNSTFLLQSTMFSYSSCLFFFLFWNYYTWLVIELLSISIPLLSLQSVLSLLTNGIRWHFGDRCCAFYSSVFKGKILTQILFSCLSWFYWL